MDSATNNLRQLVDNGMQQEEVIGVMRQQGLSIIEAIKKTRELFGVDLKVAKQTVEAHSAYASTAVPSIPFHVRLLRIFTSRSDEKSDP